MIAISLLTVPFHQSSHSTLSGVWLPSQKFRCKTRKANRLLTAHQGDLNGFCLNKFVTPIRGLSGSCPKIFRWLNFHRRLSHFVTQFKQHSTWTEAKVLATEPEVQDPVRCIRGRFPNAAVLLGVQRLDSYAIIWQSKSEFLFVKSNVNLPSESTPWINLRIKIKLQVKSSTSFVRQQWQQW